MDQIILLTLDLLAKVLPHAHAQDLEDFCTPLNVACRTYEINVNAARLAAFLAQITVESDHLWHNRDHFGTPRGEEYGSGDAYEGRHDLGNTKPGYGRRYKGRGLIQTTGLFNYDKTGAALGIDLVGHPELLLLPEWSCKSAALYFKAHGCCEAADTGAFAWITKRINGGLNGQDQREAAWARAKEALS